MAKQRLVAGLICARRLLAAASALAVVGCGGGGADSEDLQAMASTAVGGRAMPAAITIQTTSRSLDVAIDGGGAFVLRDPSNDTQVLSRRGHFDIDALGRLVNDEGWLVEGLAAGGTPTTLAELAQLPRISATLPPVATRKIAVEANLDSRNASTGGGSVMPVAFDALDADTYNNATSLTIRDELGQPIALTFYFRKISAAVWHVHATANGVAISPDAYGRPQAVAQLNFRPDGALPVNPADSSQPLPPFTFDVPPTAHGSGAVTSAIAAVEVDMSTVSSFGAPFGVTNMIQDGSPPAGLSTATVRATGELVLVYDDARVDDSRRLVLARTTVADRLHPYGVSGWLCGRGCQSPVVALPGRMLTGLLVPGALNAGT
jgi:flagellar hook protein FlgE